MKPLPHEMSATDVAAWLSKEDRPWMLDVRTREEHALAHIEGAELIPLQELEDRADELEKFVGRQVVVFCHHGVRSLSGAAYLNELGLEATSMRGGIEAWSRLVDPSVPTY